jgi:hypothetical protein
MHYWWLVTWLDCVLAWNFVPNGIYSIYILYAQLTGLRKCPMKLMQRYWRLPNKENHSTSIKPMVFDSAWNSALQFWTADSGIFQIRQHGRCFNPLKVFFVLSTLPWPSLKGRRVMSPIFERTAAFEMRCSEHFKKLCLWTHQARWTCTLAPEQRHQRLSKHTFHHSSRDSTLMQILGG